MSLSLLTFSFSSSFCKIYLSQLPLFLKYKIVWNIIVHICSFISNIPTHGSIFISGMYVTLLSSIIEETKDKWRNFEANCAVKGLLELLQKSKQAIYLVQRFYKLKLPAACFFITPWSIFSSNFILFWLLSLYMT